MKRWWFAGACIAACVCASCGDGERKEPIVQMLEPEQIIKYEASLVCEAYEMNCNGVCTDIKTSESDCGGCGHKCPEGEVCVQGICQGCQLTMCNGECVDVTADVRHCGGCGHGCAANMACSSSRCNCLEDWVDCDGDSSNGCETKGFCECTIGETQPFYTGPDGTEGVGECKSGRQVCRAFQSVHGFMTETRDITPQYTGACTELDYNCNGVPDGQEDNDGDGYTVCDGDCCDDTYSCRAEHPEFVNPGMIEVAGNELDDNCNGLVDENLSMLENVTPVSFQYYDATLTNDQQARALAQAMGIRWECKAKEVCHFGLVEARLTRSGSNVPPELHQFNVLSAMRDADGVAYVQPREGNSFAMLSTGYALDVKGGVPKESMCIESGCPNGGEMEGAPLFSKVPDIYLQAHDNMLSTHSKCPAATESPVIYDSVHLHLRLRTPINAKGIAFDFRFFTQEYPKYLCGRYNDFFLAMLTTKHPDMAAYPDHNIAFDKMGNPVSVNNGFFTTCEFRKETAGNACPAHMRSDENGNCLAIVACNGENAEGNENAAPCGCTGEGAEETCVLSSETCQDGPDVIEAVYPQPYIIDKWDWELDTPAKGEGRGGGTAWLTSTAPVLGGEEIELDFHIWDTHDGKYDSSVLLDNFRWLLDDTRVSTEIAEEIVN